MSVSNKYSESLGKLNKCIWVILIPILLDSLDLMFNWLIYKIKYIPTPNIFKIKIGLMHTPASVRFLLEDFPTSIFSLKNNMVSGLLTNIDLFTICLAITVFLVISYFTGVYLVTLSKIGEEDFSLKEVFMLDNRIWRKLFLYRLITIIPIILFMIDRTFLVTAFILIFFVYVEYSIILDKGSILTNLKKGVNFLLNNIGLTIKIAFYCGLIFSLLSVIVFPIANLGIFGIIVDIIIMAYFGTAFNKTIMEIYRNGQVEIEN
ncbi:hypothetical protein [uncultured Clostridium sp.]|uniref:hypothetical protein n=1 Tax=uncultured Clostridium sp. TaxID=59620 RepID=UPI0028F16CAB|nr:hypothetical protein [uncultured Clostridium sp.]